MAKTTDDAEDIYKLFGTDSKKEQEGVVLNYSDLFWIKIARAGGSNERYRKVLAEKTKPYRRAIQTETIAPTVVQRIMREAAAEGLVLAWGSKKFGEGQMPSKEGPALSFSVENICKFFEDLPDIFLDVQEQAGKVSLFTVGVAEDDAKNS